MPHFRVDDALNSHPKARKAGLEAMGLWVVSGAFCQAYLTDGFVPEWYVKTWPKGAALAKRLIAAGLWLTAERDGENGWLFHEWLRVQDSKEQIEADREKWRKKKQAQRESRGESPGVSPRDRQGDIGGESRESPGYTQPNPTQPIKNSGYETLEPPVGSAPNAARGTRLPDGWQPNPDVVAQMRSDHPGIDLRAEHAKFADYWRAKAGKDGRKADWTATWRNWIRRAAEQRPAHTNGNQVHKLRAVADLAREVRAEETAAQLGTAMPRELT